MTPQAVGNLDTVSGLSFHNNGSAGSKNKGETLSGGGTGGEPSQQGGMERTEWASKMKTREGAEEIRKMKAAKAKPCPVCKGKHTYSKKLTFGEMEWPSNQLEKCEAFVALNPAQRAKVLKDEGGCGQCLSWGHSQQQCNRSEARQQPGKNIEVPREGGGQGVRRVPTPNAAWKQQHQWKCEPCSGGKPSAFRSPPRHLHRRASRIIHTSRNCRGNL